MTIIHPPRRRAWFPALSGVLSLGLCFSCVAVSCHAAEGTASPSTANTGAATATAEKLLQALPQVSEITISGSEVHWSGAGQSVTVVGIDAASSDPLIRTTLGSLRVAIRLMQEHLTGVLAALPQLLDQVKTAKLDLATLVLEDGLLTGATLHQDPGEALIVLPQGIMRRQDVVTPDRQKQVSVLSEAAKALDQACSATSVNEIDQRTLQYVIDKLPGRDGGQAYDDFLPSFARRVVGHGWLRQWFTGTDAQARVAALEQAVRAAQQLDAIMVYQGDGVHLEHVTDAFGAGGWVFTTPQRVVYALPEIPPEMLDWRKGPLLTVIELPAGLDPVADARTAAKAQAARIYHGSTLLADWSLAHGFHCDADFWRETISKHGGNLAPDTIPPHIVLSALDGDIAGLAVDKGVLQPVQDASHDEAERFVTDAARLLPDAAHLDLIGEYLFAYIYPSPDAKYPQLFGTRQLNSDVQQTFYQTCGNTLGGVMHGDCADIAELYQTITDLQHRNPIVIGLPEHAACAWAQQPGKDQPWTVDVLQTGPPLEFHDASLPDCLEQAYTSFDPTMTFDANQLPLLLRFSGETARSEWALSWRIFKDPAYAHTMFGVEKDWQYETYQRGIATMKKLIADGDDDTANYEELSGLFNFTGQYDLAAQYHEKAIARTSQPDSRLYMTVTMITFLLQAGKVAPAHEQVLDILNHQLPGLKAELGGAYLPTVLQLAGACLDLDGGPVLRDDAGTIFGQILTPQITQLIAEQQVQLARVQPGQDDWGPDPLLNQIANFVTLASEFVLAQGHAPRAGDADRVALGEAVQAWIDHLAFRHLEDNSMIMDRYAMIGQWYAALSGQAAFDQELEPVAPATTAAIVHTQRQPGPALRQRDLAWIRASVPYWYACMSRLLRRDAATMDGARMARLAKHLQEAHAATLALGLSSPRFENQALLGSLQGALIAHDETTLRQVLQRVVSASDKQLMDDSAQMLGDCARFLDLDWYGRVLAAWRDIVNYKPKYLWIAWRAALNHAPRQALMVAKLAAERFPEDPAFSEEYSYMRSVLEAQVPADPPPAKPSSR